MSKKVSLESATREYETTSNFLLKSLVRLLDSCPRSRESFDKFVEHEKEVTSGFLTIEWLYLLKKDTCRFENRVSGQIIEINLRRFGEKTKKKPQHFQQFLNSSPHLNHLNDFYSKEIKSPNVQNIIQKVNRQQLYI